MRKLMGNGPLLDKILLPRNKVLTYITIILAASFVAGALWKFFDTRNWTEALGVINHIEINEDYNRPISSMSSNKRFTDYIIELEYEFNYKNKKYIGSQIYPLVPNVYSEKEHAEEILNKYNVDTSVSIYFNPNNPNDSCLITSKNTSSVKVIIITFILLLCAASTLVAVTFFINRFNN